MSSFLAVTVEFYVISMTPACILSRHPMPDRSHISRDGWELA